MFHVVEAAATKFDRDRFGSPPNRWIPVRDYSRIRHFIHAMRVQPRVNPKVRSKLGNRTARPRPVRVSAKRLGSRDITVALP
jgi:hypothetical protein